MNRSLLMLGIGLLAAAVASADLLPVRGTHYATYDMATGELDPTSGPVPCGAVCWSSTYQTGWYYDSYAYDWVVLDWGDCGDPNDPKLISGFQLAYGTEMLTPGPLDVIIRYYGEEDGWNSEDRVPLAAYTVPDLPAGGPSWNSWIVTVDLAGGFEFLLEGSDLDADGLTDFGYTYWFQGPPSGAAIGPVISGCADPNCFVDAPGQEDRFDAYLLDPCDPNLGPGTYAGTLWFGGNPYAQFWMEMYVADGNMPQGCPNPGASGWYCTADIEYSNECVVDLLDLAALLANYGLTTATHEQGDVEPENGDGVWEDGVDGDGDVDLADLARLLTQYGDDCR